MTDQKIERRKGEDRRSNRDRRSSSGDRRVKQDPAWLGERDRRRSQE